MYRVIMIYPCIHSFSAAYPGPGVFIIIIMRKDLGIMRYGSDNHETFCNYEKTCPKKI